MRSRNLVSFFLLPLIENGSNAAEKNMVMFSFGMLLDLEIFKYVASLVK